MRPSDENDEIAEHAQLRLVRNVFFLAAALLASVVAVAATGGSTTLVVTLDRDAYTARKAPAAPAFPTLKSGQFADAVEARLKILNIAHAKISQLDTEHARVMFASAIDSENFRKSFSVRSGFSIRLIDDAYVSGMPPPSGEEEIHLAQPDHDIWVKHDAIITGDMVANAKAGADPEVDQPDVEFTLTAEGGERLEAATRENVGRRFAVIVDGKVIDVPKILDPIKSGSFIITGGFTTASANALAASLSRPKDGLLLKIE
jgi:preprotein translocase subunit SecD